MSRIDFRNISKRYGAGSALTLNQVNLTIEAGEFCVFVGPSGCGKSTLLRLIAGLEDISSGELDISGVRMNDMPPAKRGVAMVFQSYALYPHMTVRENMGFGLKVASATKAEINKKVEEAAEILQLSHLLDRLPKHLSGGQRQRVAIGRAIVKKPQVFLFDEPLSNLDAALRVQTRLEIAKLHRDIGTASMVYVTHDQVEAMTLADKIVLLRTGAAVQTKGSIAQVGSPLELYYRPASLFVAEFIGSPKMNILEATLTRPDHSVSELQLVTGETTSCFSAAIDSSALATGSPVLIGIRPEDIRLVDQAATNVVSGTIAHIEKLGENSLLYVQTPCSTQLVTAKIEGTTHLRIGHLVHLHCPEKDLHVFNGEGDACQRQVELPC